MAITLRSIRKACSTFIGTVITLFIVILLPKPVLSDTQPHTKSCLATYKKEAPQYLSKTCLYSDISHYVISNELLPFTPNYSLWSDGAAKSRWIYLPPHTQIDTSDPDHWLFPVGTQFFKEFRKTITDIEGIDTEIRVETRLLMKVAPSAGIDSWSIKSYAWREDQKDAALSDGERNVLGTGHTIPTHDDCVICHKGNIDGILGFEAIQLSDLQRVQAFDHKKRPSSTSVTLKTLIDNKKLTSPVRQHNLPGTALEQQVLGYLHANCGHCHNPEGHAAEEEAEHLVLRHSLAFETVDQTQVYQTAINKPTQNFTIAPYIVMGAKYEEMALYQSALFLRMNSVDEDYRMPMVAREHVDYDALHLMHQWMLTLPTPKEYDFKFDEKREVSGDATSDNTTTADAKTKAVIPQEELVGKGLHVQLRFDKSEDIPPVVMIYWPEGEGLQNTPIMDHKEGYFTERLIVGNKGSTMSLRNSDDVGHTIYVKDKRRDIRWQLSYMPPGSTYEQELFWQEDVFVEMRCRLHLYMSAWAGSISTPYYTIIELDKGDTNKDLLITDYPDKFSDVKVWWPKTNPVEFKLKGGETKEIEIGPSGHATISRIP
ncbi:hypothetical protein A9Q99_04810 [Gammaproteobacteria bacterium 45_16_T64]|nr:hypothetical protein A9Q99_04810 [Gammaproteobacteria bacterium 45_16_T64]